LQNQIQRYHDLTAFWLDRDWKTPRERELEGKVNALERENQGLRQEKTTLKQQCNSLRQENDEHKKWHIALGYQNEALKSKNEELRSDYGELRSRFYLLATKYDRLKVFEDIPCCKCGQPMQLTREQVLRAFKEWGHSTCINRR